MIYGNHKFVGYFNIGNMGCILILLLKSPTAYGVHEIFS